MDTYLILLGSYRSYQIDKMRPASTRVLICHPRPTNCDQLVQVWQNYEWFCDQVDKMWPAGAIGTKWWLGGTKLTNWGQFLSVWQRCDWMWPGWQKRTSCVHMTKTLDIQSIPVSSMIAMFPIKSIMPLPLLSSVAAGHRTIRFLLIDVYRRSKPTVRFKKVTPAGLRIATKLSIRTRTGILNNRPVTTASCFSILPFLKVPLITSFLTKEGFEALRCIVWLVLLFGKRICRVKLKWIAIKISYSSSIGALSSRV
jgi:hypothetical protein